jgi:hypothetical protein
VNGTGQLVFDIPNDQQTALHQKELWLQVTFFAPAPIIPPGVLITDPFNTPFALTAGPFTTTLPGGWTHQLTKWSFPMCPGFEHVTLFPPQPGTTLFVDQVVIDTQCFQIPAPGPTALAALGGLVAVRRRRR